MGSKKGKRNTKKNKTNQRKSRSKPKRKEKKHSTKSESKGRKSRGKGYENEKIENEKRFEDEDRRCALNHTSSSDSALDFWGIAKQFGVQNSKTDRKPKTPPRSESNESTLSTRYALNHPKAGQTIADRNARFETRPTASPSSPLSGFPKRRSSLHEILDRPPIDLQHQYVRPQIQNAFQQQKSGQNYGFIPDYGRRPRTPEPQYSGSSNSGQPKQFAVNQNQYSKGPVISYGSRQRPKSSLSKGNPNQYKGNPNQYKGNDWPNIEPQYWE